MDCYTNQLFVSALLPESYPEVYAALAHLPHQLLPHTADIWCRDYMPMARADGRL
jgi:hypothetical protein